MIKSGKSGWRNVTVALAKKTTLEKNELSQTIRTNRLVNIPGRIVRIALLAVGILLHLIEYSQSII